MSTINYTTNFDQDYTFRKWVSDDAGRRGWAVLRFSDAVGYRAIWLNGGWINLTLNVRDQHYQFQIGQSPIETVKLWIQ